MADQVIDIAEMRKRLRPPPAPESFATSLTRTLANIDAVRAAQRIQTDG